MVKKQNKMLRDYTKYNVEGLGENLNKRQFTFSNTKRSVRIYKGFIGLTINLIFIIFTSGPTYSQSSIKISEYSFEELKKYAPQTVSPFGKKQKKKIKSWRFNEEKEKQFNKKISNTINFWNYVYDVKKLKKQKVIFGEDERPITKQEIISFVNLNELLAKQNRHTRISPVVTVERDTLLLFYLSRSLVCKDMVEVNKLYKKWKKLKLKEDVINLEKHISVLKEEGLKLTKAEKAQLNKNIQNRIIKAIDSLKFPKYYLVSVNRTEPAAQTKSYFYIVEKHSDNRFYSLGNEHDEFPVMDAVLNDQILVDTIQLIIDKNKMRVFIRSTDYVTAFSGSGTGWAGLEGKGQYRSLGGPNLNSSDTLFMTTSDGGGFSNMRNPLYLDNFPTYREFSQKYLLDVTGKDIPLSKLGTKIGSRGYAIVENHIYSKDSISLAVNKTRGAYSEPISSSYGGTVYGSNKKEIYDYAEQFHKFYKGWKQEKVEEKQKKELAAEQEKEQQKQELAKKYGRKYVDAMYDLKIIVGMHEDLVNNIVSKLYTVGTSSSSNNGNYYRLEPRYGTGWVSVWIKNKKVTSVTYH